MQISKNILVAPLNWGLGHATRCIPIINAIIRNGDNPIIASDGMALELLKKEFPRLKFIELPSYEISYPEKGQFLKLKLLKDSPKIWNAIRKEHLMLAELIAHHQLDGVISDNRLGLYSKIIPSVIITHQLQVLSGSTTWLSTQLHLHYIKKFDYCWIPDVDGILNLSGLLSQHTDDDIFKVYLGPLSRFERNPKSQIKYDLMVLLSGPEPQRSILERKLLSEVKRFSGEVLFIAGNVRGKQQMEKKGDITYYNYLSTEGLQKALDRSDIILSRSGYTTIMDLHKLGKKAFFIPTPGQFEQEYLAQSLDDQGIVPFASQEDFKIEMLEKIKLYKGLDSIYSSTTTSISDILSETFSNVNENSEPIPGSLST
ncbi:glycosyltransferase [Nonlabens ulvanivorans]|uniref:glycosyltransferase n=1 Tax=Nonlabens ulvanivorans TaxID=906888 RepID=UPI0029434A81|nr:glycosyltransferase [Nonlabens ulvanivorans]WOI22050.1 glycosyltransferase [Nonlabens ulvanivorans]